MHRMRKNDWKNPEISEYRYLKSGKIYITRQSGVLKLVCVNKLIGWLIDCKMWQEVELHILVYCKQWVVIVAWNLSHKLKCCVLSHQKVVSVARSAVLSVNRCAFYIPRWKSLTLDGVDNSLWCAAAAAGGQAEETTEASPAPAYVAPEELTPAEGRMQQCFKDKIWL